MTLDFSSTLNIGFDMPILLILYVCENPECELSFYAMA